MLAALSLLFYASASVCAIEFSDRPRNFSIELIYHTQQETNGHFVIAPFGIWTMMSGIALGATGESYKQLARAFLLPAGKEPLVNGYKDLTETVLNTKTEGVKITSKNFVFIDNSFKVFPDFRRSMENDFEASVSNFDFKNRRAADIANYIIEKGAGFKDVLQSNDFVHSKMLLTNVLSFRGQWSLPFNVSETKQEMFYDEKGKPIGPVNMMSTSAAFNVSNLRDMEALALELPYGDNQKYSMLFLLPHHNVKTSDVYAKLQTVTIKDIFEKLENDYETFYGQEIKIKIPRFHVSTNVVMNKILNKMGVFDIFDADRARFDLISNDDVYVSAVIHKADIEVTETGTVATATTVVNFLDKTTSVDFFANRPFIYFLIEKSTMTMVFGGIYSTPTLY